MENEKEQNGNGSGKCPFGGGTKYATSGRLSNRHWWPESLDLSILRQNSSLSDPMGEDFDYAEEFKSLDLDSVVKDLEALIDRKSTRLNSSHRCISYAVFCL